MFYHLGRIATRFRWLIVGLWMVAIAIALPFAPQASQVLHSGGFFSSDIESERAVNLLVQKLHIDLTVVQVIFTSQRYSADSPQFEQEAQQALANLRSWSEVSGMVSFTDNPRQISLDRHAAYMDVLLKSDPDSAPKLIPELEHRLLPVPDLKTSVGGGSVFYEDIQSVSERDLRRAEFLAFPLAVLALLLVFRSVVAALLPALVGGGAVVVSLALIFALGQITTLSIFVLNMTTLLGPRGPDLFPRQYDAFGRSGRSAGSHTGGAGCDYSVARCSHHYRHKGERFSCSHSEIMEKGHPPQKCRGK